MLQMNVPDFNLVTCKDCDKLTKEKTGQSILMSEDIWHCAKCAKINDQRQLDWEARGCPSVPVALD